MGPGVQKYHNMDEHRRNMSRKIEKVKSPKTDSPDLIPEGLGAAQGDPWAPQAPLESNPENPFLDFQLFQIFDSFFVDFRVYYGIS